MIHSRMFNRNQFRVLIDWFHFISFIDNSTTLYRILPLSKNELQAIDTSITSIIIPHWTCNDIDYTIFDFSRFNIIESIEIGDNCFGSVQTFQIDGLNRLKTIKIGKNSFTQVKQAIWKIMNHSKKDNRCNRSKSFHILDCESLESIQIGAYSFSDYAGEFELKNLPKLQSIQIGTIGRRSLYKWINPDENDSCNFYSASFVIRGIDMILNIWMIRSSKSTIHCIRW